MINENTEKLLIELVGSVKKLESIVEKQGEQIRELRSLLLQKNDTSENLLQDRLVVIDNGITSDLKDERKEIGYKGIESTICNTYVDKEQTETKLPTFSYNDQKDNSESQSLEIPPTIIPKNLDIKYYKCVYNIANIGTELFDRHFWRPDIATISMLLSFIGKEIVFYKTNKITKQDIEKYDNILKYSRVLEDTKRSGDKLGYQKAKNAFENKYHIGNQYFYDKKPVDFIPEKDMDLLSCSCFLHEFLVKWKDEIDKEYNKIGFQDFEIMDYCIRFKKCYNRIYDDDSIFNHDIFNALYDSLKCGYSFCIIPIFDENILYRPKSAANDGTYFSLLYYDKYVVIEDIENEKSETANILNGSSLGKYYSRFGTEFVSSHYRRGHFRNGHWVSGGLVRGHFRRR